MEQLQIKIHNIKHIKDADVSIPVENGIYAFVGANGSGKSTLMLCLSRLVRRRNDLFSEGDVVDDSFFKFVTADGCCTWKINSSNQWIWIGDNIRYNGMYEGSLFYGTRFEESLSVEKYIRQGKIDDNNTADADDFVKETLSFILHGDKNHYSTLKRIKNRQIAKELGFTNLPHFIKIESHIVSQYRMSSGECLLISLIHFLYNSIVRRSLPADKKIFVLIDEIELALHPIAVVRLLDFLNNLIDSHSNLTVYLSTHSPEIIKAIAPKNIYRVIYNSGILTLESNCYPSYLIRDLYSNISPDFLLLVEDNLAMQFVNRILAKYNLRTSKLVHVVPVGGWQNVIELHKELYGKKVLGTNTKIISILDGDVEGKMTKQQMNIPHCFLPIMSIEKFLYSVIKENSNPSLRRIINDKYFIVKSLDEIATEYNSKTIIGAKDDNKNFYAKLIAELSKIGTKEEIFIIGLCDDIEQNVNSSDFVNNLRTMLV